MGTLLSGISLPWWADVGLVAVIVIGYVVHKVMVANLKTEVAIQQGIVKWQAQEIEGLQERIKHAEIRRRHEEVARTLSDGALHERMQHEGYYRD